MYFFTIFSSAAHNTVVPRALRMNFRERLIMPWRLPAWPALILPEAVTLKRFLAPDLVFILGISISYIRLVNHATRHTLQAGHVNNSGAIGRLRGECKGFY